jgi:5-methyltetrahydrofolate--homocysteine methyltransferase
MWSIVRAKRLGGFKFRRQHVIGNYIADFVCLPARLVIEIDGDTLGSDAEELQGAQRQDSKRQDSKRTEEIERAGYRIIRFLNRDVLEDRDDGVEDAILQALMASPLSPEDKERLEAYVDAPFPDPLP